MGKSIHFCLGAPLVRWEARIAFDALLRRFPKMCLATEGVVWRQHLNLRGAEAISLLKR